MHYIIQEIWNCKYNRINEKKKLLKKIEKFLQKLLLQKYKNDVDLD